MKAAAWVLTALVAGIFACFQWVVGPKLEAFAGGLAVFDTRLTGYSLAEARAYLDALPPEGVAYYLGVFHPLDFVFPIAVALWLALPLWRLAGASRVLGLLPAGYALADYAENLTVRQILQGGSDDLILRASLLTQTKWALAPAAIIAAVGAVLYHWRVARNGA